MDTDESLVERFRLDQDEEAFEMLVLRHRQDVYRLAYRMAGCHQDAHDIAQESFVRVYRALPAFRAESSFRTWLYRIVVNLSLNHIRKTQRERMSRVNVEDLNLQVAAQGLSSLLEQEVRERVRSAIDQLPPRQQRTLVLKIFHELKYTDIAAVMGCTVGTAKANFFHAVQSLRHKLGATSSPVPAKRDTPAIDLALPEA